MNFLHVPVLLAATVELLNPRPDQNFIDGTLGDGGHTELILEKTSPQGKVLAIDLDERAIRAARKRLAKFKSRVIFTQDNFKNIKEIANVYKFHPISGILLDLGFSRGELKDQGRGISFLKEAPLDMRFNKLDEKGFTASYIINNYPEKELYKIFREYGEERFAGRIARAIIGRRREQEIKTTFELADIIRSSVPKNYQRGRIDPATRVFQALRIAVNDELENLRQVLPPAVELLEKGGRLAVISFHSLEDRIVKRFFKKESTDCLCPKEIPVCRCGHQAKIKLITKKAIKPSEEEIRANPSSRSARLRVAEKI